MKKIFKTFLISAIAITLGSASFGQKLPTFSAELGKKVVMGKDVRIPYTSVVSYFDYVMPGAAPDEVRQNRKYYYVYVWVPIAAPEIGIRMISPVPNKAKTKDTDYITQDYLDNKNDTEKYFDT